MSEPIDLGSRHLAVDALGDNHCQLRIAKPANRLLNLLPYRKDLDLDIISIFRPQAVNPDHESFENIDVIGTAKTVIGSEHNHAYTFHFTDTYQRRIKFRISGQNVPHDRTELILERLKSAQGLFVLVHLGR